MTKKYASKQNSVLIFFLEILITITFVYGNQKNLIANSQNSGSIVVNVNEGEH